jgi:uncharacterized protein YbaP (TraB family)
MFRAPNLASLPSRLAIVLALLLVALRCAYADPALWVVKSQSATVYLFGTVHILPKSTVWHTPAIDSALAASSELWTEADLGDLSDAVSAIRHYGLGPAGETERLLPDSYRERYRNQVAQTPVNPTLLTYARPWLAEILLSTGAMQRAGVSSEGVEFSLLGYAHAHKMLTPTFETMDEQFAMLADMGQEAQLASLEDTIDEFDQAGALFRKIVTAWKAGDVDSMDRLINQAMRAKSEAVWTEIILRRNERFSEKINDRLQGAGTAFVAVGAGHMCGSDGIPELLKRRGFTVKRVE